MNSSICFILILVLFSSCQQPKEEKIQQDEFAAKSEAAIKQLSNRLMTVVSSKINEEGVTGAIEYCSENALPITKSVSDENELSISRVSHRNRNPGNAANELEKKLIQNYLNQIEKGSPLQPEIINEDNRLLYYSPIIINMPLCLNCHGKKEAIAPEVLRIINDNYPNDKATGFITGDLRGLFKVEYLK